MVRNPLQRGSAPDRARPAYLRRGSFKRGHEKRGGRKRGTPNLISADLKSALSQAARRVGYDGNGKDGLLGYLTWIGETDPTLFYTEVWPLPRFEILENDRAPESGPALERPPLTKEQLNLIGLGSKKRRKPQAGRASGDWTGLPGPVSGLMTLAITNPRAFWRQFVAAFLYPSSRRRSRKAD